MLVVMFPFSFLNTEIIHTILYIVLIMVFKFLWFVLCTLQLCFLIVIKKLKRSELQNRREFFSLYLRCLCVLILHAVSK